MKVIVVPYSPLWAEAYECEAREIRQILGGLLVELHHIGSTAVRGLAAKPIIDIMPVVSDIAAVDPLNPKFEALGYTYMGEFGLPGRRYFRKGGDDRTHQIHIFEVGNRGDVVRHLAVRDYLRAHPGAAVEYENLKTELARRFPDDIDGYCDGKDAFVKRLETKAMIWNQSGRAGPQGGVETVLS